MLKVFPENLKFKDHTLITGFHGIGATGYWAIKYLVQHLEAERVAVVDTDNVSPVTSTIGGKVATPYALHKVNDLVFFRAEVQPLRGDEITFFREISQWIIDSGFKEVALIGGLDKSLKTDESNYRLVHTSSYTPKDVLENAPKLENNKLIVGPVALMLNYFEARGFPAYAILSYASTEHVDPRASASAVEALSKYYSFNVDLTTLIKQAEELESQVAIHEDTSKREADSIYT